MSDGIFSLKSLKGGYGGKAFLRKFSPDKTYIMPSRSAATAAAVVVVATAVSAAARAHHNEDEDEKDDPPAIVSAKA